MQENSMSYALIGSGKVGHALETLDFVKFD
jgi:hypothetical protein